MPIPQALQKICSRDFHSEEYSVIPSCYELLRVCYEIAELGYFKSQLQLSLLRTVVRLLGHCATAIDFTNMWMWMYLSEGEIKQRTMLHPLLVLWPLGRTILGSVYPVKDKDEKRQLSHIIKNTSKLIVMLRKLCTKISEDA